jgi:hypothetical protein
LPLNCLAYSLTLMMEEVCILWNNVRLLLDCMILQPRR